MKTLTLGILASTALLGWTQVANAAFFVTAPGATLPIPTVCDPTNVVLVCNDFAAELTAGSGSATYINEGVLNHADAGILQYTVYAWENGFVNSFLADGFSASTTSLMSDFSAKDSGWVMHAGGVLDFTFCASDGPVCVANADNGVGNPANDAERGIGFIIDTTNPNIAWLLWDDNGISENDDNHDDMIVRVEWMQVPEPATLGMLGLGLLGLGFGARRRRA